MSSGSPPPAGAPGSLRLRIENGPAAGRELWIVGLSRVGREAGQEIVLDDSLASRHHADIYPALGRFCIADAGSANGTRINGERIQEPRFLSIGDVIAVGNTRLRVVAVKQESIPGPVPSTNRWRAPLLVMILLLVAGIGGTGVFLVLHSRRSAPAQAGLPGALPPGPSATRGLFGSYLFESETGGTRPIENAEVVLKFIPPGRVTLRAVRPGEVLTDVGSFSIDGDRITLDLPGIGKRAQSAAFTFDGVRLVLPFRIIGDGDGTSNWQRMESEPDPLSGAIERYYTDVGKQGRTACLETLASELRRAPTVSDATVYDGRTLLVTYLSGYQEFFLAPPLYTGPDRPPAAEPEEEAPQGLDLPMSENRSASDGLMKVACSADDLPWRSGDESDLNGHLLPVQFLPGGAGIPGGPGGFNAKSRFEAWLGPEPEPVSQGDAPQAKAALILAPYQSLPVLLPGSQRDHYSSFGEYGENPGYVAGVLQKAGYQVEGPLLDAQVTVKRLYELLKDRAWGVLYFSTHGGDVGDETVLSTGQQVPARVNTSHASREKYLQDSVTRDLGKDAWVKLKESLMVGFVYDDVPFISIKSGFFRVVNADFSAGLAYMSGCETAHSTYLRGNLHARSFVGWKGETHMELTGDMSNAFWRCLGRKTRSDRESMDWGINYLLGAKGYNEKMSIYGPTYDPNKLVVYRAGQVEPEKRLTGPQHLMLYTCRIYALRKRAAGNDEDLPGIVAQLYVCNEENSGTGLGANPFCREALNGVQSDTSVIDEVKGELCGYGSARSRFALVEK